MKKTSFRTSTNFTICAVIIATLSLAHLAWGQGEQAEAEQVQREASRDTGGPEKGAVARILAGVDEGKISKEKATEMIAALSKSIDQENQEEDRNLKEMLEGYWRADPSIRAGYAMRIEMYPQHKAAGQGRNNERGSQRGGERPLSPAVARLHREVGNYDFTARINVDAVGQDGGVINLQGTADVQMILDGQFLLNRGLQGGNESVTIIGVTGGDDDEYFRFSLDGGQTGFMYAEGGFQDDGSRVLTHPGGGRGPDYAFRTTFEEGGGFTTSFLVGPQQAEFLNVTHTRARRRPTDVLETMLSSPVKPTSVNRSANSPDPGANFSPEHLVLQEFAGDFTVEGGAGEVRSRMICRGRFLISEMSMDDDEVIVLTGFDSAKKLFQQIVLDPDVKGFRLLEGTQQANGAIVLRSGLGDLMWTLTRHEDGAYTFDDGGRSMRFRPTVNRRPRGVAGGHVDQRRDEQHNQKQEQSSGEARVRAERLMRDTLKVMRDADKLTDEQVEELFNIVFPKDIDPKKSTRQRLMSFGMYFAGLIDSGQVERFDKDMQKVYDVGVAEIERQGGKKERGQAEDRARGNDRAMLSRKRAVPGTLKWSVPLGGIVGYCSPAIAEDGTIYIGGGENTLHALNPDGTRKWDFAASGAVVATPTIAKDGTIYIGTHGRRIHAITADGTEKWSYPVGDKIDFSSPAIGKDGTIHVGCYDDHLYAINPDGTKKWSFLAEFNLFSSPAVGQDGTIYIGSENGKLYAVNPEDGTEKWSFQTGQYIHASPSIAKDGTVYIGSSDKNLYAIDPKDGSEKWRFAAKDQVHAPPAIGKDGTLYFGSNDGNFYALNPDGTEKWRFRTGKRVDNCSAAIGKDGTIYFGSDDNHIYALNPDGSEKWRFEMNGVDDMDSSPAIGDDGTIYVASRDGNLYAINGESGGLAKTPWPMFGLDPHHTGQARPGGYSPPAMKLIPKGQYEMGNHNQNGHEKLNDFALPVHAVSIDAFRMDIYELTNQKYCEYLNSAYGLGLIKVSDGVVHKAGDTEPYCDTNKTSPNSRIRWDGKVFTVTEGKEDHPMVEVSWYGAVAFANWKSAKAGLTPCYDLETWECNFDADGFRLPTEAEWEKAARGGEHNPYYDWPWGNSIDGSNANYMNSGDPFDRDMPATTPVGYYDGGQTPKGQDMANGYGLYDMAGNVFEWCYDWYDEKYYSISPKDNPRGPESGITRVCRCGSWGYTWSTAMRVGLFHPDYRGSTVGFRLVRKN